MLRRKDTTVFRKKTRKSSITTITAAQLKESQILLQKEIRGLAEYGQNFICHHPNQNLPQQGTG